MRFLIKKKKLSQKSKGELVKSESRGKGRPSSYNDNLAKEICMAISTSIYGLKKICELNPHFPAAETICRWVVLNEEFYQQYTRARIHQAEMQADHALDIAFDGSDDTIIDENGKEKCNNEWLARSRLIVDTIKWRASKLVPKIYGDKLESTQHITVSERFTRIKKAMKETKKHDEE